MKVFILTEGTRNTGFGHVTRCISLYQAFEENNINPALIINGDDSITGSVAVENFEIFDWTQNQQLLMDRISGSDSVIIDSYLCGKEVYETISQIVKIPVYIDDYLRIDYPHGTIVNGTIGAESLTYPGDNNINCLLGHEYILLRKSFWDVPPIKIRKEIETVLITFGGDDLKNLTQIILKNLIANFPQWKKLVVIGNAFKKVDEISAKSDSNTELIYSPDAEEMKNLMLASDLAFCAGGQTLNELARTGCPANVILIADNQRYNVKGWGDLGFINYLGNFNDRNLEEKLEASFKKIVDYNWRLKASEVGQNQVDGKGCLRIIEHIKNLVN